MADYRLSAQIISRAKGQSAIASAAYRAAVRLDDPTTGVIHDFTRKAGVVHSEVLAPDDAPAWMRDRAQLWQAVEVAEKRRDAQLARELQLSLPHELTDEQRKALLLSFVRDNFVSRGMVADVNIHAPGRDGDDRNHHAHVMLTMRSLTGEGFGNKVRDWNSSDTLLQWREAWAQHQNRELERHGHAARVDHRSFEDRGIDREPTQHLGPTAAKIERLGRTSRIGDENRERELNNAARADRYRQHLDIDTRREKARAEFEGWAERKAASIAAAAERSFGRDSVAMAKHHDQQRDQLRADLSQQYGTHKATIRGEVEAVDRRLQARGVRKVFRDIFGRTRSDEKARQDLAGSLRQITSREQDARRALQRRQVADRGQLRTRTDEEKQRRLDGIERRREERRQAGWAEPKSPLQEQFDRSQAQPKKWYEKGRADDAPSIQQPWRSSALDQKRPWESDLGRDRGPTRERRPDNDPKPKKD